MESYWHLRIAWWLLAAALLESALAGHVSRPTDTLHKRAAYYHQQPPNIPNRVSKPGAFSAGGGDYGNRHLYSSSRRFGHYLGGSPPGYKSSYSLMPGLFDSHDCRGRLHLSSYESSPFGYSKNFFRPSLPTVISLPITHYHYPSNSPPRTWGCKCYFKERTAVCKYKLEDEVIPPCVDSSVTALFIQSEEVDWLSVNAFRHVPNLEYINITGTMLHSLLGNLFHHTQNLKHLVVQKNYDLRALYSDVFRGAINLEDVILDRNDISSLDRDVFTHLTNLKRLNLAYNELRSLPEGIFRNNQQLQELVLSGNALHIEANTARDLLTNNGRLRVLLMRNCKLKDLPTDLLRNASSLEWLDLSRNKISKFPSEFIQDCTKLAYLGLAYNKLEVLGSDLLQQRSGSLATLDLEGNPWHCDCDILPLAVWTTLQKYAIPGRPKCSSPRYIGKVPLQQWFLSEDATRCAGRTSSLRTDLNRVLSVARAIAKEGPSFFANMLRVSDGEVSFTATNYFLYAMAARTDSDVDTVVWHWARFLEKVLDRRHLRHSAKLGFNTIYSDRMELFRIQLERDTLPNFNFDFSLDPLATTTTKPPVARPIGYPLRSKGFEPLVNFTYIMKNIPENLTEVVDHGIEEEVKILFGVIKDKNAANLITTADDATALDSTGVKKLNDAELIVSGLRSELREVLATLVLSISQVKWDAAEQNFIEEQEKKAQKPLQKPRLPPPAADAGSHMLMQHRLTATVTFLTLLALTLA